MFPVPDPDQLIFPGDAQLGGGVFMLTLQTRGPCCIKAVQVLDRSMPCCLKIAALSSSSFKFCDECDVCSAPAEGYDCSD